MIPASLSLIQLPTLARTGGNWYPAFTFLKRHHVMRKSCVFSRNEPEAVSLRRLSKRSGKSTVGPCGAGGVSAGRRIGVGEIDGHSNGYGEVVMVRVALCSFY